MIGKTYKVKTGYGSLYITINNDEHGEPFEIFATIGKSGGFFQEQSEAICRLISISLRSGMKISEIIDNLKGIRGPMPTMTEKGTILSLPDAIGKILEEHTKISETLVTPTDETSKIQNLSEETKQESVRQSIADYGVMPGCPDCGSALQIAEGCMSCKSCGFSRCG
jgi:ribonucleoside-diphosphate reductase alpha chain